MLRTLSLIAALVVALGAVGLIDHAWKTRQMHRADVAWWFCANDRTGCGSNPERLEHRADRIEQAWQERERVYTLLLGALIGAGVMTVLGRGRSRRGPVASPLHS